MVSRVHVVRHNGASASMKSPVLVAIANFLLPGLGYLILRKRATFGAILFVGTLLGVIYSFGFSPDLVWDNGTWLGFVGGLMTLIAFGYDAYQLANEQ